MPDFEIQDVTGWMPHSEEPLGSKDKDWMRPEPESTKLWLYKMCRSDAGDDWAEKLAEQLCGLLGLPHARVSLATRHGSRGVIVEDFRQQDGKPVASFTPANELLWRADRNYPRRRKRDVAEYTVERCLNLLTELRLEPPIIGVDVESAPGPHACFVGYLLLDAWIGNQDRHHENWGVVSLDAGQPRQGHFLAPSFDHGSSLGNNETDEKREFRLTTTDQHGTLEAWARKAKSQFYLRTDEAGPCTTARAFFDAQTRCPSAAEHWLERLAAVLDREIEGCVAKVPDALLSTVGKRFTLRLLDLNRRQLLSHPRP